MVIVAAEGLGWSSREAAGQRVAAGWISWAGAALKVRRRGQHQVLQRGCKGQGVLWFVQCAQWTVMPALMLGGDLDAATERWGKG